MTIPFLGLPLEIRRPIYEAAFPVVRNEFGEPLVIYTDKDYRRRYNKHRHPCRDPLVIQHDTFAIGLMRSCRQVNHEAAPFLYVEQRFMFSDAEAGRDWLLCRGKTNCSYIRHLLLFDFYVSLDAEDEVNGVRTNPEADTCAALIKEVPNLLSLEVASGFSDTRGCNQPQYEFWGRKEGNPACIYPVFLEAVVNLQLLHSLHLYEDKVFLDLTKKKPMLEILVLDGVPQVGEDWSMNGYLDNLPQLKHLSLRSMIGVQCGNSRLPKDFFTHIAPLESFEWHGEYLLPNHRSTFLSRHGATLQVLSLSFVRTRCNHPPNGECSLQTNPQFLDTRHDHLCMVVVHLLRNLPVLENLRLDFETDAEMSYLASLPASLKSLEFGWKGRYDPLLEEHLMALPVICPNLKHLRLANINHLYHAQHPDEGQTPCHMPENWHRVLNFLSRQGIDVQYLGCIANRCNEVTRRRFWYRRQIKRLHKVGLRRRLFSVGTGARPWEELLLLSDELEYSETAAL
ncbi:hypothetical protein MMC24_002268 [Lignoscripta atroalba]|nr:hypothetical protein [Lignoscripta atroalba]